MHVVQNVAEMLAAVCCSLFAGATLYIKLVEHPARLECAPENAATEFPPRDHRTARMQASVATLGFGFAVLGWLVECRRVPPPTH